MPMKIARQLARLNLEAVSEFRRGQIGPLGQGAEGSTRERMATFEMFFRIPEQVSRNSLVVVLACGPIETEELLAKEPDLASRELKRAGLSGQGPAQASRCELRSEGNHDELQIVGSLKHFMILARAQQENITRIHVEEEVPYSHPCTTMKNEVQFRLGVEVAGPAERGAMKPGLRSMLGQHRERLIDGRHCEQE